MALKFEFVCLLLSLTALLVDSTSTGWWSLGLSACADDKGRNCNNCDSLMQDGILDSQQKDLCSTQSGVAPTVPAIARGTRQAIIQCQSQFDNSKWNCTTFEGNNLFGSFVNNLHTRETAALFGYLTAGATHALSEACGQINECPCVIEEYNATEGVVLSPHCSDNTPWAIDYIRRFLAAAGLTNAGDMCDQNNIKLGSKLVEKTSKYCRCHGISGTCSTQTCYERAPALSEVSEVLRTLYDGAVQVELVNGSLERATSFAANEYDPESELCYVDSSPNFCDLDRQQGILGTAHRLCDISDNSPRSCSSLCCGRGHYTLTHTEDVEDCRFVYCCEIKCETTSQKVVTEYRCNP